MTVLGRQHKEREVEREEQRTGEQRSQFFLMSRSGE